MNLLQFLSAAAGEPLNRWLLDVAVRSTLLLLIAAGTILALRRISAAGRHFLWGLGLICSLLLPFVVAITPAIQWKIIPAAVQPVSDSHSTGQNSELTAQVLRPRTANFGTPPTPLERIPESLTGALADNRPLSLPPTAPAKSRSAIVLSSKLPWILWAIGAMVTGAYFAAGWVGILRLCRKLEPIRDEECSRHAQQFAASAGLRATPLLMQSREVGVPFTLGCNSGVIVLPRGWTEWTVERRRFVLMHEIAHIRRHDWLTQWLGWLAATVYWFNPVVWSAVKQVRIEAEKACDDAVLRAGHAASDYAEELLAIAAALPSARTPIPPAIPMAQRAKFEERIQSILNARVNRSPSSKVLVVGSVLGVMLLLPVLAAVEITTKVEAAAAAPSLAEDTKTTSSSVPLKDSIRSVSGKVSIEILFLGSDNIVNGLLSPDGKKIAFMDWEWRKPNYKKHDLIVRNLATGQEVPVTQKAGGNPEVYELASFAYFGSGPGCWSPDSQWVSYVWYTDQYLMNRKSGVSTELRIAKADGSESKVLKDEDHWRPYAWSPDGRHLLCDFSRRENEPRPALLNIETGASTEIPEQLGRPAFSPDGQWIVGVKIKEGRGDVHLINVKTRQAHPLVNDPTDERAATFSKDGRHVLFTSNRRDNWDLWAVKVKEGKKDGEPILVKRDFGNHPIRILDSGKIVFNTRDSNEDVFSVSVGPGPNDALSPPRRLSKSHHGKNSGVAWSPDGARIAYLRMGPPHLICIQKLEGDAEELIDPKISFRPRQLLWSPDGQHLVLKYGPRFVVYSLKDGASKVYSLKDGVSKVRGDRACIQGWARDGKRLYVCLPPPQAKLAAINISDGTQEDVSFPEFDATPGEFDVSPDGQKILGVLWKQGEFSKLVLLDRSSKTQRTVARYDESGAVLKAPRWSPDGNYYAYLDHDSLVVESASADLKQSLLIPKLASSSFDRSPSWSPDGKQIALTINDGDFGEIGLLSVDLP